MKFSLKQALAILAVTSSMAYTSAAFADTTEVIPKWAATEIASWKEMGLLKGDKDGKVLPNEGIRKTEFVTLINRIFNFSAVSSETFKDVPLTAWYAPEISKAVAAGAILGNGEGGIEPLEVLTREKAALILSRVFNVATSASSGVAFADDAAISSWAKEAVYAMKAAGYVEGTPEATFQPKKELTRAEAVKMINRAMGILITDGGEHSGISSSSMIVNRPGAVLSNLNLTGNLYITPGVGEGDLSLQSAVIGGVAYINGGGANSITITDSKIKRIVINKPSSPIRVVLKGTTTLPLIDVLSGSQVVNESNNPIDTINVLTNGLADVSLNGNVNQLNLAGKTRFVFNGGEITSFKVASLAAESRIQLVKGASIKKLFFNGGAEVTGEGTIAEAEVNAEGVSLASMPNKLTVNASKVTINGHDYKGSGNGVPNTSSSSGGSGSGSSGTENPGTGNPGTGNPGTGEPGTVDPEPKATVLYSYEEVLKSFSSTGAEGTAKQYITFLQDPSYKPSIANSAVVMPDLTNAITFVNYQFNAKPSIFASLRGINSSVLDKNRTYLWIGTDSGVTRIKLSTNEMLAYTAETKQLTDNKVLLLISDGSTGVLAITETGVSHIYQ
ncbi:hypothetical protein BSK65_06650 [Paenibacillus odorifer]|uniref:SLH domain-containing protein n=1 Tax=Paenibacillus odorifer TaxID=189426 RepID=A0A1R0ZK57_9BACL|nr:S-layer homology domain-containing protein [Paenibacillus odorifer]OME72054.1 hypothetical protein BSK65_06650 [Paenibacillus odorifer]